MYKGYAVAEEIIHDYEYPETAIVLDAPCGCYACDEEVQAGHFACSCSPAELTNDENVSRRLDNSRWFWVYRGPPKNIDSMLEVSESPITDNEFDVSVWYKRLDQHQKA